MSLVSLKRFFGIALLTLCTLSFAAATAGAQQPAPQRGARLFAVLPFKVNNPTYRYMSPGAQAMMASRLAWTGYFEPAQQASVARVGDRLPVRLSEAETAMATIGCEYLVAGTLNFQGKTVEADLTVWTRTGQKWTKSVKNIPMEGLVPALNRLAGEVRTKIFRGPAEDNTAPGEKKPAASGAAPATNAAVPANAAILAGDSEDAPLGPAGGPVLNPQFRYEGGAQTPGRWRSQSLPFAATNMAVGNFAGDKKNHIILATDTTLYVYDFYRNTLKPVTKHLVGPRIKILRVSLMDVDHDGVDEIIVSAVDDPAGNSIPRSYIFKYENGTFKPLLKKPVNYYLSVMRVPPSYSLTLLGQRKAFRGPFEQGVSEMMYKDGELTPLQRLHLPDAANVFNFMYLPDGDTYKIVMLNEYNYIKVFTPNLGVQYSTKEGYNSSAIGLLDSNRHPGMNMKPESGMEDYSYIPIRMIPAKLEAGGKYELLMNKDISVAAQVFERFRRFSQGEVHSMFWDGVGMSLAWKTRRIKGTVVDLGMADLKNDGKKQLIICLNTFSNAMSMSDEKTVVIAYDLNAPKK